MSATDSKFGEFLEAYFSDESIDEGMHVVVSLAKNDPAFHVEVLHWLSDACLKLKNGEREVLQQIERGNFVASQNAELAIKLVELLRDKYLQLYSGSQPLAVR